MKKLLIAVVALFSAALVYAESYTVKSVTGKATVQTGSDKWVELAEGKTVTSANVINTSLNSLLVLADENGKEIKIKANQKGTVDILVNAALNPSVGIKKAKITTGAVAGATSGNSKGTATASSRASEAKEDIDWDE
ncbi:hypothetical protein [Treponema sp.]|uniref:hypothetical protein n=1 Tax=Treponema sp. TaxID=166 RepID=UPI00298DC20E|nr:hypothetical protein [Treponema sp.]MCQ2240199.1 hypothetical protein [Treponema sp.]